MIVKTHTVARKAKGSKTQEIGLVVKKDLRATHHEVLLDTGSVVRMPRA